MRLLLAISVSNVTVASRNVSTICASMIGAVIRSSGSSANTAVPSGTAHTSPPKCICREKIEEVFSDA